VELRLAAEELLKNPLPTPKIVQNKRFDHLMARI
jgi:hypothetical protein